MFGKRMFSFFPAALALLPRAVANTCCVLDSGGSKCELKTDLIEKFIEGLDKTLAQVVKGEMQCSESTSNSSCVGACQWSKEEKECEMDMGQFMQKQMTNKTLQAMTNKTEECMPLGDTACANKPGCEYVDKACGVSGAATIGIIFSGNTWTNTLMTEMTKCAKFTKDKCVGHCEWDEEEKECSVTIKKSMEILGAKGFEALDKKGKTCRARNKDTCTDPCETIQNSTQGGTVSSASMSLLSGVIGLIAVALHFSVD